MEHHDLDVHLIPKEAAVRFINEPWLIDGSFECLNTYSNEPDDQSDNIRIYIPMDLNREAILRRLRWTIDRYGSSSEANESNFSYDVSRIISQIEIYDQIWRVRKFDARYKHSKEAINLIREVIELLKEIPDDCSEVFPFELIDGK